MRLMAENALFCTSLPGVAVDDAESGNDGHADEPGQRHYDPAVREASTDDRRQEQRLGAAGDCVPDLVFTLV